MRTGSAAEEGCTAPKRIAQARKQEEVDAHMPTACPNRAAVAPVDIAAAAAAGTEIGGVAGRGIAHTRSTGLTAATNDPGVVNRGGRNAASIHAGSGHCDRYVRQALEAATEAN